MSGKDLCFHVINEFVIYRWSSSSFAFDDAFCVEFSLSLIQLEIEMIYLRFAEIYKVLQSHKK